MTSRTTPAFWEEYAKLTALERQDADEHFEEFEANPRAARVQFKKIHGSLFSARAGQGRRALALVEADVATWF